MRDRFGIFGTITRFRELSLLLEMMLRIPNIDESNTSCDAVADWGVKPERRGVNSGTYSKLDEIAPWET